MAAAGHEERNRDDHCERMLALAKVMYSSSQRASHWIEEKQSTSYLSSAG